MPKTFDVRFTNIICDSNGFGDPVKFDGEVFVELFHLSQSEPPELKKSIYPFPSGPISISEGERVPIDIEHSTRFSLRGSLDPVGSFSMFGRVGGALNLGLGSSFRTFGPGDFVAFSPDTTVVPVKFEAANLAVTLQFLMSMQSF